jgi:exodeoxyribonuclease VIII
MSDRLSFADYKKIEAVNWTTLKEMRRSPLHYKHRLENERADSDTLAVGRATHTAILEPDLFPIQFAVYDGIRRGKEWEQFKGAHAKQTIIKRADYDRCLAMRDAVRAHPLAAPYLAHGLAEQSITWTDKGTGIKCKARLDFVSDSRPAILDLKTSATIDAARFGAIAARLGYHDQAAFYSDGFDAVHRQTLPFILIAVENEPPYDVGAFVVETDEALYLGQREYHELLERVAECRSVDCWPGQYGAERMLELPRWAFPENDDGGELTATVIEEETADAR